MPPSQGGKYGGFGYTREAPPRSQSQEFFDTTMSSLASVCIKSNEYKKLIIKLLKFINSIILYFQGWSFLSSSATKIASKASESAIKYGGIATQKVADISTHVGDKVFFIFCSFWFMILY